MPIIAKKLSHCIECNELLESRKTDIFVLLVAANEVLKRADGLELLYRRNPRVLTLGTHGNLPQRTLLVYFLYGCYCLWRVAHGRHDSTA